MDLFSIAPKCPRTLLELFSPLPKCPTNGFGAIFAQKGFLKIFFLLKKDLGFESGYGRPNRTIFSEEKGSSKTHHECADGARIQKLTNLASTYFWGRGYYFPIVCKKAHSG